MVNKAVVKNIYCEIFIPYLGKRSCTLIAKSLQASLASRVRLLYPVSGSFLKSTLDSSITSASSILFQSNVLYLP